jgi:hypothetical protein
MVASRKARRANERVQTGRVQFVVVTPVGLFLSEVNWVGEFFQARCRLLDPVFSHWVFGAKRQRLCK